MFSQKWYDLSHKKEKGTYLRYEHCKSNDHNGEFSLGYGIIHPANDHNDDFSLGLYKMAWFSKIIETTAQEKQKLDFV